MANKRINVLQLSECLGVMCDLGNVVKEKGVNVLALQEPYVSNGRVSGLPNEMRVYMKDGKS